MKIKDYPSLLNGKTKRRNFLRGAGAMVALPWLEALVPAAQACSAANPNFIVIYTPNGVTLDDWYSVQPGNGSHAGQRYDDWRKNGKNKSPVVVSGNNWKPARNMQPLVEAGLKSKISLYNHISNQDLQGSGLGYDGGQHPPGTTAFLNCTGPRNKSPLRSEQSFDQVLADYYRSQNSISSVNLASGIKHYGADRIPVGYSETISWKADGRPTTAYVSPRDAFRDYFGGITAQKESSADESDGFDKSMLDYVLADAEVLRKQLGADDKHRLDSYLDSVRELEMSIGPGPGGPGPIKPLPGSCKKGSPDYPHYVLGKTGKDYDRIKHMRMNFEIMELALQCRLTNVCTYVIDHENSHFSYPKFGSHHSASHQDHNDLSGILDLLVGEAAKFLKRLDQVSVEGTGLSILDNSVAIMGSGIMGRFRKGSAKKDDHQRYAIPLLFAGSGGGKVKTNQEVGLRPDTKMANMYQTLMREVYCTTQRDFVNGDGIIKEMLV